MSRVFSENIFIPNLSFRFKVKIEGQAPGMEFYARAVNLPTWRRDTGWQNPINIRCYHFQDITIKEVSTINPVDVNLTISIVDPTEKIIYEWKLLGDIEEINYGTLDRGVDDVTELIIIYNPKECIIAL